MNGAVLLAKRPADLERPREAETLKGHSLNVLSVAQTLLERVGVLASLGISAAYQPVLARGLLLSAIMHDIGKASEPFQRLLRKTWKPPLPIPHETASLLAVLQDQALSRWLFERETPLTRALVLWAVAGHHLRFDAQPSNLASGLLRFKLYLGHPDVASMLGKAAERLQLDSPPALQDIEIDVLDARSQSSRWLLPQIRLYDQLTGEEKRLAAAVKGLLIAADVVGSAVPKRGTDPALWAGKALARRLAASETCKIVSHRLGQNRPRQFQEAVRNARSRVTLVSAGCGTGKTTAAYLWALEHAKGRKLFFCYPTTGTATSGFEEYALPVEDVDKALVHSRAQMDIEHLYGTAAETSGDHGTEEQQRWDSLTGWDVPLVICTADTVLGLIQNQRRPLFMFPLLLDGAFVFDEVHAYDNRLFQALLHFLTAFQGVPVLLMSASLPPSRKRMLEAALAELHEPLEEVHGPPDFEELPRYQWHWAEPQEAKKEALALVRRGGKVLWVMNTVARAMDLARELEAPSLQVELYHSRYRYIDRLQRHKAVISAFKSGAVLAVTTQVAEMSLDLSADLLVTELAPIPALIQRMGRLNRRAAPGEAVGPAPCLVLQPLDATPYDHRELAQAREWFSLLGEGVARSQRDLSETFVRLVDNERFAPVRSAWLDGGPISSQASLRTAGYTAPVIRAEDVQVAAAAPSPGGYAIPMPVGPVSRQIGSWRRIGPARVAPAGWIDYDERWGAAWVPPLHNA